MRKLTGIFVILLFFAPPAFADVKTAVTAFLTGTNTGIMDIEIPGFGQPKAVLFFYTAASQNLVSGTTELHCYMGMGATSGVLSGSTKQWAVGTVDEGNVATTDSYRRGVIDETIVLVKYTGSGTILAEADFNKWLPDGIRIDWGYNDLVSGTTMIAVFFGGSDTTALSGVSSLGNASAEITVDTPGFEPDLVFGSCIGTPLNDASGGHFIFSFGVAVNDGSATQKCVGHCSQDNVATSNTGGIARSNAFANQTLWSTETWYAVINSFGPSGFKIQTNNNSGDDEFGYLALNFNNNADVWVGGIDSPVATGVTAFTGIGFTPKIVGLYESGISTWDTHDTTGEGAVGSISVFDDTYEFTEGFLIQEGVGTSKTYSFSALSAVSGFKHTGAMSIDGLYASMDADGFSINMMRADVGGTARKWIGWAIAEKTVAAPAKKAPTWLLLTKLIPDEWWTE